MAKSSTAAIRGAGPTAGPAQDWAEKYRPHSLDQVVGHPSAVKELRSWGRQWGMEKPPDYALVLAGPASSRKPCVGMVEGLDTLRWPDGCIASG